MIIDKFRSYINLTFQRTIFLSNIKSEKQILWTAFSVSIIIRKDYLVKICNLGSNLLTRWKKILLIYPLKYQILPSSLWNLSTFIMLLAPKHKTLYSRVSRVNTGKPNWDVQSCQNFSVREMSLTSFTEWNYGIWKHLCLIAHRQIKTPF